MARLAPVLTLMAALASPAAAQSVAPSAPAPTTAAPQALDPEEMAEASGGQGVTVDVLTRQQLSGVTSDNTINAGALTSGDVTFGPDALDGFSGVGNFVINTGANNTLQGAINISIVTTPGS